MRINYPAVIVAAIAHFIIGGLWYGLIFANKFVEFIGWGPEKLQQMENQNHTKQYIIAFLSSLLLVYILAHFVQFTKAKSALDGVQTAFWLWLGFIAATQLPTVIFEERNLGLYFLSIGYQFVACAIAGIILTVWKPREAKEAAAQPA